MNGTSQQGIYRNGVRFQPEVRFLPQGTAGIPVSIPMSHLSAHLFRLALPVLILAAAGACLPAATPLPPLPSATPSPPSETPTPTIIWFPPTATYTPFPTPTPPLTPTVDTRPSYGSLILADDFQETAAWVTGQLPAGTVTLNQGSISLVVSQERGYLSTMRQNTALTDFYAQITANPTLCRGADEYGLLLRVSGNDFYRFSLSCDGQARLDRLLNGSASSPKPWTQNGAIPPGSPSLSQLAVQAIGRQMRFYVNDAFVFEINDGTIPSGGLGLFARAASDTPVSVSFSDLKVYRPVK
jgi:hypothetical protein